MATAPIRKTDIQDAVLRWLNTEESRGNDEADVDPEGIRAALGQGAPAIGWREIAQATTALHAAGLISGTETWQRGIARPSLTPSGRRLVESGGSVRTYVPASESVDNSITIGSFTNNQGAAVVGHQNSRINQQIANNGPDEKIAELLTLLRNYLAAEPSNAEEVGWITDQIEEAAEDPAANRGVLRTFITRVRAAVMNQLVPVLSDEIVAVGGEVLHMLTS